jgi:hypothetical protein
MEFHMKQHKQKGQIMQKPSMTKDQMRKVVRKAYTPTASREYTDAEVDSEIDRLMTKGKDGYLMDDFSIHLYARLHCTY